MARQPKLMKEPQLLSDEEAEFDDTQDDLYNPDDNNYQGNNMNNINEYGPDNNANLNTEKIFELHKLAWKKLRVGNTGEAWILYERLIKIHLQMYGGNSFEFQDFFERLIKEQNEFAQAQINNNQVDIAYKLQKQCEKWSSPWCFGFTSTPKIITLNHQGCCMRRVGKPRSALKYLESGKELIFTTENHDQLATTCQNLCSVYAQMGQNAKALENAKEAVSEFGQLIQEIDESQFENPKDYKKAYLDKIRTLAISYYNIGCQEEHFARWKKALRAYEKAMHLTEKNFKPSDNLARKFKTDYENFKKRMIEYGYNTSRNNSVLSERGGNNEQRINRSTSGNRVNHNSSTHRPGSAKLNTKASQRVPEWKYKDNPYAKKNKLHNNHYTVPYQAKPQKKREIKVAPNIMAHKNDYNITRKIEVKQNNFMQKPKFGDYNNKQKNNNSTYPEYNTTSTGNPYNNLDSNNRLDKVIGSNPQNFYGFDSSKNFNPNKPQNPLGMNNKSAKELNHIQKLKNNDMLNFSDDEDEETFNNYEKTGQLTAKDYQRKMENTTQFLKEFSSTK